MWKSLLFALLLVGVFAEEINIENGKEQLQQMLRTQCAKYDATDKIGDVTNSAHGFIDCVKSLINVDELKKEIEDAKPRGALDEVFNKYCAKTGQLKTCIHTFFDGMTPCIDPSAREQIPSAKEGVDQLIDFVCYKDGDRIALFIAENGPECFRSQMNAIRNCATTIKDSVPQDQISKLTLSEKCGKFDELSLCIVRELEKCDTPTPGNMAESLFKYVRKGSPCNAALPPKNN